MIDLKEIKDAIKKMNQANDATASMNAEVWLAHQVPELLKRLESAERKIKKYGKGSEALCRAFGVN